MGSGGDLIQCVTSTVSMTDSSWTDRVQLNRSKFRSSALLNTDDPVTMHLLMETAIGDSQGYEVLSFEEVDEFKREYSFLENRIQATRRKLTLESKLRDAAQSLNRLYSAKPGEGSMGGSPGSINRHRRSMMGSRGSGSDLLSKTDGELSASTKKCEELAQELWRFEKRAQEIQRRLLQHTAGILQMTHRGVVKKGHNPDMLALLPEDIGTFGLGLAGFGNIDGADDFDHRSYYRSLDGSDEFGVAHDGSRSRRTDLQTSTTSLSSITPSNPEFIQQTQAILATETKLESLNKHLREILAQTNLEKEDGYSAPPTRQLNGEAQHPGAGLQAQLDYLEYGLHIMGSSQSRAMDNATQSTSVTGEQLHNANARLHSLIQESQSNHSQPYDSPPGLDGTNAEVQIHYLEDGLDIIDRRMHDLVNAAHAPSTRSIEQQENAEQTKSVLKGLWDIVTLGDAETRERRQQIQKDRGLLPHEESVSGGEFSLQRFSAEIQSLYTRATGLQEQKDILTRQIQQQRELNAKSDSQREAQTSQLTQELQHAKTALDASYREIEDVKDELTIITKNLDAARQETLLREQQETMTDANALKAEKDARKQFQERMSHEVKLKQDEISRLESELADVRDDAGIARAEMQGSEAKIQELVEQLDEMMRSREVLERNEANFRRQIDDKSNEAENVQAEMSRLEGEVVRLQTEVTVARAELDGAYGTRAQRAAEVAANPALQKELDELVERNNFLLKKVAVLEEQKQSEGSNTEMHDRIDTLQRELTETIAEYENMIRSNIESEKEREQLEIVIDELRDRCEALETQISDEKVKWLGMKVPGPSTRDGGPIETTSTMVLKNEFKKMMRDTRAENTRALRVSASRCTDVPDMGADIIEQAEQEERRKLESLIRTLRRDQTPVKSALSQSMTAH